MQPMFDAINKFLDENDSYDTGKQVTVEFRANYEPPSFIQTINNVV